VNAACTEDCLCSLHSRDYVWTPKCSFSFWRSSLHNPLPSASSPSELKGKVTLSYSNCWKLTNRLNAVRLPGTHSIDHQQILAQFRSVVASKCTSNLPQSRPPSSSPQWVNHSLQVYLHTGSITACMFTQWCPSSVSPHSLNYGLQVYIIELTWLRPPGVSPHSFHYSLQVHMILPSKWISKLAWSRPQSVSLRSLDRHFQTHLELLSSTVCIQYRYTVC